MKLRFGYGLLLVVGMISSCTSSPSFEACERFAWRDLGEPVFLQGDSVVFDEMLMQPTRVAVVDSFLITKNQNAERFFYVYNVDTRRKVGERIPFGIGPDEMIDPVWMLMPDGDLGVLDRNQRRMDIYPGHELLVSDSVKPVRHFSFNELLLNAMVLPGRGFVSSTLESEEHRFALFDFNGERTVYFGEYPKAYQDGTTYEKYMEFTATMAAKPDGSCWVVAHQLTDMLEIYDDSLKLVKRIQGPDGFFPQMEEVNGHIRHNRKERNAYFFPFATDKYIYVLYDGRVYDLESPTRYLRDKLFVLDWNGTPVKYYQLSEPVFHFAIDVRNGTLYGLSDLPEFHIVSYALPDFESPYEGVFIKTVVPDG